MRLPRTLAPLAALALVASAAPAGSDDWSAWEPALAGHELRALEGGSVTLKEMRGDVVVVNFWASWCKPCKKELVSLDEWNGSLGDRGARIVAVSIDRDRRKAERFVASSRLTLPVYHDGPTGLAETLDLPSLPCTVVLDAAGNVVSVEGGGSKETLQRVRRTVDSLLKEASRVPGGVAEVSG